MSDEWKLALPFILILAVLLGFRMRGWWRQRTLRRAMCAEGRFVEGRSPSKHWKWFWIVPLTVLMVWIAPLLEPRLGRQAMPVLAGAVFVVIIGGGIVRVMLRRDGLISQANELAEKGKVEEAVAGLRAALAQHADGRRAQALAMILFNAGRADEAVEALRVARRMKPEDVSNDVMEGLALLKLKQADRALAVVEKARGRWVNEAGLAYLNALALADLRRLDEAAEQYRQGNELGAVAVEDQSVDLLTRGNLMTMAKKRLDEEGVSTRSARAFEVIDGKKGPEGAG